MPTFTQALSTNNYGPAKFIVSANNYEGTHTTIAAAIAAAVSGETIFLRPGTYTENLSLKVGVNIVAYLQDGNRPNVTITGKATLSTAGTCTFGGIKFLTNGDNIFSVTGSAASVIDCTNCTFISAGNDIFNMASSSGSAIIQCYYCQGDITSGTAKYFAQSGGNIIIAHSNFQNAAASTTASTTSAGICRILWSTFNQPVTTTSTGGIRHNYSECDLSGQNVIAITHGGSDASSETRFSNFSTGTASGISIGGTMGVYNTEVFSTNTNPITGAGIIGFSNITFTTSGVLMNTTSQFGKSIVSGQISFDGGTTYLNNYTTGTFNPTVRGDGTAGSGTYSTQVGRYTRIGNRVYVQMYIIWTNLTGGTGNLQVASLPITSSSTANTFPALSVWSSSLTFGSGTLSAYVNNNATTITLNLTASGSAAANFAIDTSASLMLCGFYEV